MLLGKSTANYIFITAIVYLSSYLGLLCLLYFYLALTIGGVKFIQHPASLAIEGLGALEILFYLLWFLPYRAYLQRQAPAFPPPLDRKQRQDLFSRSLAVTPDIELWVKKWMGGISLEDLRRENVKEWLLWALFDREGTPGDDNNELEGYIETIEEALGRNIRPGRGPGTSIRVNFWKPTISHRSLTYYLAIGTIDLWCTFILLCMGFRFYRQPVLKFFKTFPFRPLTLLSLRRSAAPNIGYFYRPHKSTTHRPIVFIHGVGIGLAPYLRFFHKIPKDIGILAIEILPVSSRITEAALMPADYAREIGDIVTQHGIFEFTLIANSSGTFFTKLFLETRFLFSRVARIILIDPTAILLHVPDLMYNATSRIPKHPNEMQVSWAATTEPDVAFTLTKRFNWRSHVLWREDLLKCPTTVVMGSEDCVVNAEAIAAYITKGTPGPDPTSVGAKPDLRWSWTDRVSWKRNQWGGEGLELYWVEGYDHGQSLLSSGVLRSIVNVVERYSVKDGEMVPETPQKELPPPPPFELDFDTASRKTGTTLVGGKRDSGITQAESINSRSEIMHVGLGRQFL